MPDCRRQRVCRPRAAVAGLSSITSWGREPWQAHRKSTFQPRAIRRAGPRAQVDARCRLRNQDFNRRKSTGFSTMEIEHSHEAKPIPKKPYEKPSFRHEQVFVTTALSCGKIGATTAECTARPSAS